MGTNDINPRRQAKPTERKRTPARSLLAYLLAALVGAVVLPLLLLFIMALGNDAGGPMFLIFAVPFSAAAGAILGLVTKMLVNFRI